MANVSGSLSLTHLQLQTMRLATTEERIFKMFLVLGTHVVFIYINLAMLFTLWSKPSFRHTARYILFAHMLFNDTIHLAITLALYMLGNIYLFVVRVACAFMVLLSSCTFTNAPLNLAVMSLERAILLLVTCAVYPRASADSWVAAGEGCGPEYTAVCVSNSCAGLHLRGHHAGGPVRLIL